MEMTPSYLRETAEHLAASGYALETSEDQHEREGLLLFVRTRYDLRCGEAEHLALECLEYADGVVRWYLAVEAWHGLTSTSFPLDSWKHRPDRIEFKYETSAATSLGLAFVVQLPRPG